MNVRVTPRAELQRTDTYTGVARCHSDGVTLRLYFWNLESVSLPLRSIVEILIDADGAVT